MIKVDFEDNIRVFEGKGAFGLAEAIEDCLEQGYRPVTMPQLLNLVLLGPEDKRLRGPFVTSSLARAYGLSGLDDRYSVAFDHSEDGKIDPTVLRDSRSNNWHESLRGDTATRFKQPVFKGGQSSCNSLYVHGFGAKTNPRWVWSREEFYDDPIVVAFSDGYELQEGFVGQDSKYNLKMPVSVVPMQDLLERDDLQKNGPICRPLSVRLGDNHDYFCYDMSTTPYLGGRVLGIRNIERFNFGYDKHEKQRITVPKNGLLVSISCTPPSWL